jgi:hypothetical protein
MAPRLQIHRHRPLCPDALDESVPLLIQLRQAEIVPDLEPQVGLAHLGQARPVLGADEGGHLSVRDLGHLGVDLGLEELLYRHSTLLRLLGQQPVADELLEFLVEQGIALFLDLGELDPQSLLHLLQGDDLVAHLCRGGRALAPRRLLRACHVDSAEERQHRYRRHDHPPGTCHRPFVFPLRSRLVVPFAPCPATSSTPRPPWCTKYTRGRRLPRSPRLGASILGSAQASGVYSIIQMTRPVNLGDLLDRSRPAAATALRKD